MICIDGTGRWIEGADICGRITSGVYGLWETCTIVQKFHIVFTNHICKLKYLRNQHKNIYDPTAQNTNK